VKSMRARRRNSELTTVGAEAPGQLLFITLDDYKWSSSCERVLGRYQPGGVLLTQRNLRSPQATCEMLSRIVRVLRVPPFLALSEEGGTVDPLRAFFPPLPAPHIAAVKGSRMVERLGALVGEAMALLGFNMNFAPRLDLANQCVKPSLEPQSFSGDPRSVVRCGEAFLTGLWRHKVLACGKHFPGLSAVEYDGGSITPLVDKPMATLWREDLVPYRQLLPRLAMVKLSYAAYKAYDLDLPTPVPLSVNVIGGLLRVKLGFRGVVVADHFLAIQQMGVAIPRPDPTGPERALSFNFEPFAKSVIAGCDMLVMGWGGSLIEPVAEKLRQALDAGTLPTQRVTEALKRIRRAKKGIRLPTGKFSTKAFERLCREFEAFGTECRSAERKNV
jgi:beta-N-acetylhexosaminidase